MKHRFRPDGFFLRDLPHLGAGEGDFFDRSPLFRVFLIDGEMTSLRGVLSWVDMWYSGMISRVLSSIVRSGKPLPPSLLFVPGKPPLQKGFLLVQRELLQEDPVEKLAGLLAGMGVERAVLDGTLLFRDELPDASRRDETEAGESRRDFLFLSDPNGLPASCILRGA